MYLFRNLGILSTNIESIHRAEEQVNSAIADQDVFTTQQEVVRFTVHGEISEENKTPLTEFEPEVECVLQDVDGFTEDKYESIIAKGKSFIAELADFKQPEYTSMIPPPLLSI